jgi:PmbA protein
MSDAPAPLLDVLDRLVAQAAAGEALEAYGVDETETSVRVHGGDVEALSSARTRGVGIRVLRDGRVGYAHTSDLTEAALAEALAEARANATASDPDDANMLALPAESEPVKGLYAPEAEATPTTAKVETALALERAVRSTGPPITGVDTAHYGDDWGEVAIASTTGLRSTYRRSDAFVIVEALAEAGGASTSAYGLDLARHHDALDPEGAAAEAVQRATRLLGGRKPSSRRLPVVLDPYVTAMLLGVLGGALTAEAAQRGRSLFTGRVGETFGPSHLTLVDDGRRTDGPASAPFDGEGTPTSRTPLLAGGVLQGFLHNLFTAARDGTVSTGNARRASHRTTPASGPTNLALEPGDLAPEQLVAEVDDGFYCQQVMGLHSGANPISGEVSVGAAGMLIRDGELTEAVREATIATTIPHLLAEVVEIGSDLRFLPVGGGMGGTTVLVDGVMLAGA